MTQPEITGFRIALRNFEGPFDLLLQLIQAKKMDITDVALSEVTDEFVGYTRQLGENADLDGVSVHAGGARCVSVTTAEAARSMRCGDACRYARGCDEGRLKAG